MALITNFNADPYFDDFSDNKNYYRVLFKPGNAVQARELTQLQTSLQDQIKKFGDHIFKTGSVVTGGQVTIQNTAYLNISSTYSTQDVSYLNFDKQVIQNSANTKRAYVLKSYAANTSGSEPITLIINQLYGDSFSSSETIYTANTDPSVITYYANTTSSNPTGNCQAFSVNEGVFYYDGFFVKTLPQSVAVNKYDRQGSALVGFTVNEELVDYTEDTTLLDPAQGSSNFQAPGADRYKIELILDTRPIDSTDLQRFIELGTMQDGVPQKVVQTPIYAAIGDELARRTVDESGDYVIKNFNLELTDSVANSAFANVSLGSGKAYIKGYEFVTDFPEVITIPKPRTTETVENKRISVDYGYYVFANSLFGNFGTNQYSNVELSLLDTGAVRSYLTAPAGSSLIYANTVIGNAKIKLVTFYSAAGGTANTLDSNNYIYKVFLTDINTGSIGANAGYGINATGGSTSTIQFPATYAANNDVYKGLSVRIVSYDGSAVNDSRIITDYDGATRTATVTPNFNQTVTTSTRFILDSKFASVESLVARNSLTDTNLLAHANISPLSKNQSIGTTPGSLALAQQFQPVFVYDSRSEPLLIKIGESNIADNTIADFSYSYRRLYQTVTFTSGVSQPLSVGTGESLQEATTTSEKQQYYQVIVTTPPTGTPWYYAGQTVPAQAITSVSTASRTLTIDNAGDMTANIYAIVNAGAPTSKTKRFITANNTLVDPTSGRKPFKVFSGNSAAFVAPFDGQTIIDESFVQRKPGSVQHLFTTDVYSLVSVLDFSGTAITTSSYNAGSYANVTSRYTLDTGQKDSYYDWSSIVLKPGQNPPRGPLLVQYNRFTSNGSGYFDVDSYTRLGRQEDGGSGIDYGSIPVFTSQDGTPVALKDYFDFRPVRSDAANAVFTSVTGDYLANNFVLSINESVLGPQIAEPGLDIITNYEYYLPRIDRVVLTKNREFLVLQGTPSVNPVVPVEPEDSMTLYILSYPPYLSFATATAIQTFTHKRYTMKDIARLDKRIQNLELYTSLTFAELATVNKNDRSVRDDKGIARPKNGLLVDSFVSKDAAAFDKTDFSAAIDIVGRVCRGSYNISSTRVFSNNSTNNLNVEIDGPLMMIASSNTTFLSQNKASRTLNINPFNIVNYVGSVKLDPQTDIWKSETRVESQNIDLSGGQAAKDAWSSIQSTSWGAWNTTWSSTTQERLSSSTSVDVIGNAAGLAAGFEASGGKIVQTWGAAVARADVDYITSTKVAETTTLEKARTGILSQIVPVELSQSIGDKLVDVSVIQYMRAINILVLAEKFKPFTTLYAFFDNVKVNDKIGKINRFEMSENNLQYQTTISNAEAVTFYKATSNTALSSTDTEIGTGGVVLTSNNNAFIVSMNPVASFGSWSSCATNGIWVKGDVTGKTYRATNWYHQTGVALAGSASTITLAFTAGGATNISNYAGKVIYIVAGKGQGQSATISSYDSSTRIATITGTWTTIPDTTSIYSIGELETTKEGASAGVFFLPADVFRTGEKVLRLIDDQFNNIENSRTNGDVKFLAQGTLNTLQEQIVTVFTPTVSRTTVNEKTSETTTSIKTVTSTVRKNNVVIGYYDPLAQTFLVNPNQYPQGIIIDSIRVCFKTKDSSVPVTCQIRPVQNGYPSSAVIYPFAEKTITPDKVNLTDSPDLNDPTKYTEFKFDVPVLLLPGEHSFVLASNSNGYEAYIAEIGATDLVTNNKISEQPYTGSLFLSQNGSTWTADQLSDIMFSVQKRVFSTGIGIANFEVDMSEYSNDVPFDVMQLMSTDAKVTNTDILYEFVSELDSGSTQPLLRIIPNVDYECTDGYGRRVLKTSTGNTTFQVRATLTSSNPDISPMIDLTRLNLLSIENKINNLPLQNSGFVIVNQGSGYTGNATVTIDYPDGSVGQGAGGSAVGVYDPTSGKIIRIDLTNAGTGYITSPRITLNAPASGTDTAVVTYNGEDKALGGNAEIRYITKRVKLAPGFDAGDFRVYMDVYRPPGSGVLVYYKLLSESDSANFDDNNYQLMTESASTRDVTSATNADWFEVSFAPGDFRSGVFDNKIEYTSSNGSKYKDFSLFQIKVVMYGSSTVNVPKIAQLRVIALPASSLSSS